MVNTAGMDPLDFLTKEQLLRFLHIKKTELSCLEKPHIFLNQLRDYNLVPEDQYQKVSRMKSKQQREKGLYQILDWLETERPHCINLFWRCLFQDHIMLEYPVIRLLRNSLLDGSFHFVEDLPEKQETSEVCKKEEKKEAKGKKCVKKSDKKRSESVEVEEDEEPGPSTRSKPSKRKRQQKLSFSSPIKKGAKEDVWNWPIYKTQLPVTCGDKEGLLQRDKMARGEECILSEGRWFTPSAFEEFGGKKTYRNWKQSIRCQNTPLQKLFKEGHLKCPSFKSRRSLNSQSKKGCWSASSSRKISVQSSETRRTLSPPAGQLGHKFSESESDFEEEEAQEDSDTEIEEEEEQGGDEEEEENREGEGGRNEDPEAAGNGNDEAASEFSVVRLPVTCGSATGTLQKDRFGSGTSGKCIRTATRWMTPVEFSREDPTLANSFWRRSILVQGEPLSNLIERRVLMIHSLLCKCKNCSKEQRDLDEQKNDDHCSVCGRRGSLLCCDQCPRAFHPGCHIPTVEENKLGEQWLCTFCVLTENQRWSYLCDRSRAQAMDCCVSDFLLQCHYLLLHLYSSDEDHIFSSNPCTDVPRYREFIKNPMWLDKIAEKLQNKLYSSVGQFYSDVDLIFKNCATFNRDNEFGPVGTRLKQLFEEEFQQVFSVKS
ncbi:hypothetical protein GJAV_G00222950 [Gymnothorax javanicus]|nr:hypothetical protein GJAV_G00222950 [Gymnothorax javanicus]